MNFNERFKKSFLWIIRWVIFLPAILIVTSLWQFFIQNYLSNWTWWSAIPLWTFFGPVFCISTVYGVGLICPNRKIGNFLFLGIFLVGEGVDFYQEIFMSTALLNILRGWSDICIIIGLVSAALVKLDTEKKLE